MTRALGIARRMGAALLLAGALPAGADAAPLQTPDRTGKEFAVDLKGRKMRLPVLLALRMAAPSARRRIRGFLVGRSSPPPLLKEVVHDIRDSGALEECTAIARSHIARAKRSLASAADGVCRGALTWLAGSLLRAQKLE